MTDGNPRPEEEPAPPASTGRSQTPDAQDDGISPPFVPGRSGSGTEPTPEDAEATGEDAPGPLAAPFDPERGADETDEAAFPFEAGWEADRWQRGEGSGTSDEEDDFPIEAFDLEEGRPSWLEDAPPSETEAAEIQGMRAARELADRLEEMARRLRDQGPEAVRAELESADRFNALLAGLLAGYLAGRE